MIFILLYHYIHLVNTLINKKLILKTNNEKKI